MFFHYPNDAKANALQYQYFYGPGLLVAPVTEENSTSTTIYLPDDVFYDYYTHATVRGTGAEITLDDVAFTSIPLYYKGGSIVALRANSANTTTELRKENFKLIIAPALDGTAKGDLYLDDGESVEQKATSVIHFAYAKGVFTTSGSFGYDAGVSIESVVVLGGNASSTAATAGGAKSRLLSAAIPLTGPTTVNL